MIKVPLHNLKIILKEVDNSPSKFIELVDNSTLPSIPKILFPFKVCISKYISKEDSYSISLIDIIALRLVGRKVQVYMEYQYRYEHKPVLMSFEYTTKLHYVKSSKYLSGCYSGHLTLGHHKDLPYPLPPCSNEEYYNQVPQVERVMFLSSFLVPYLHSKKSNTNTPYEYWILDYISKFELLCRLRSSYNTLLRRTNCNLDVYTSQIDNIQTQLIEDINNLIDNYIP